MKDQMKHQAKDNVFAMLCRDEKYLMGLYRALHPEDDSVTPEDLKLLTLETALVTSYYNDLGLQVRAVVILLLEAQSVWSPNIVLRLLLYLAETLDQYITEHEINLHSTKAAVIPRPELYVVYTGKQDVPPVLHLSDLYADKLEDPAENAARVRELREKYGWLDLEVRVLRRTGSRDLLDQYVRYCEINDEEREKTGRTIETVRRIIQRCVEEGVLVDFLLSRRMEVESAMKHMFDEETARKFYEKEIREESRKEEAERGIRALIATVKQFTQNKDAAVQGLMQQFNLLPQVAAEKVALYW